MQFWFVSTPAILSCMLYMYNPKKFLLDTFLQRSKPCQRLVSNAISSLRLLVRLSLSRLTLSSPFTFYFHPFLWDHCQEFHWAGVWRALLWVWSRAWWGGHWAQWWGQRGGRLQDWYRSQQVWRKIVIFDFIGFFSGTTCCASRELLGLFWFFRENWRHPSTPWQQPVRWDPMLSIQFYFTPKKF